MLITVTGGSGSGKSAFAEQTAVRLAGASVPAAEKLPHPAGKENMYLAAPVYLATMLSDSPDSRERIARHRKLRQGKGFLTLERPADLAGICPDQIAKRTVLLEDLSNLIANELFGSDGSEKGALPEEAVFRRIRQGLLHLERHSANLVVVLNEIFSDGIDYSPETETFMRLTGALNRSLAEAADQAWEVVCGIPVRLS